MAEERAGRWGSSRRAQEAPNINRNVDEVPYVEMHNGRVQGVVKSGSDYERVYVNYFEAGTFQFNCSTNNNRPCSGAGRRPCKHLANLMDEAVEQYGAPAVARYLKVPEDPTTVTTAGQLMRFITGSNNGKSAGEVFSRFLADLQYVELPADSDPAPEMEWF